MSSKAHLEKKPVPFFFFLEKFDTFAIVFIFVGTGYAFNSLLQKVKSLFNITSKLKATELTYYTSQLRYLKYLLDI